MLKPSSTWRTLVKIIMTIRSTIKNLSIFSLLLLMLLLTACGSSAEEESAAPPPTNTPIPPVMEETVAEADDADSNESEEEETEEEVASEEVSEPEEVAEVEETAEAVEEEVPYSGRSPEDMWTSLACSACHQLDENQTESNRGPVGPHQGNLAERVAQIAPDQSPEEYVYTSIADPSAYVVEGYFEGIMPATYADQMSEEEIRELARWLLDR